MSFSGDDILLMVNEEPPALVPDGDYRVACVSWERRRYYGGQKLYVKFKICDEGPHLGRILYRAYNFYDPLKRASDLFKDLALLHGKPVRKGEYLPLKHFRDKIFRVKARTVTTDRKQRPLPVEQQYSVVDEILEVEAGA